MNTQLTAASYDNLASHWNSEEFNRGNGIAQHKRAFRFAARKQNAIDIGCGSSGRIIDLLISEGFEAEGLDVSPEMIRMAKQRHPEVLFHLADICICRHLEYDQHPELHLYLIVQRAEQAPFNGDKRPV